jgi:hypothetical protein
MVTRTTARLPRRDFKPTAPSAGATLTATLPSSGRFERFYSYRVSENRNEAMVAKSRFQGM